MQAVWIYRAILIAAVALVFFVSAIGIFREFRLSFLNLTVTEAGSLRLRSVLREPLTTSPGLRGLSLRVRVIAWPAIVVFVFGSLSYAAVSWDDLQKLVGSLLPKIYSDILSTPLFSQTRALGTAMTMVFVYSLVRLPQPPRRAGSSAPAVEGFSFAKLVSLYYTLRALWVEEIVFWGKRDELIRDIAIDLRRALLPDSEAHKDAVGRVLQDLAVNTGQPAGSSPHAILIHLVKTLGLHRAEQEITELLPRVMRREVRRGSNLVFQLASPGSGAPLSVHIPAFGLTSWHNVHSMTIDGGAAAPKEGSYQIQRINERVVRHRGRNWNVALEVNSSGRAYLRATAMSRHLGDAISRCC
jgi:hypothetical protein